MKYLYGAPIKQEIKSALKEKIEAYVADSKPAPHLGIIQVGNNERSAIYIQQKQKFAHYIGGRATLYEYPEDLDTDQIIEVLKSHIENNDIHGIIIQMPLPVTFSKQDVDRILASLPARKDADGLSLENAGLLFQNGKDAIIPATTRGILNMCEYYQIPIEGQNVTIVGRSNLVGKPTALAFLAKGATVSICHSKTKNLATYIKNSNIVITATGIPNLINKEMMVAGQHFIDVGISMNPTGGIQGDINHDGIEDVLGDTGAISPVPGGVGPLTVSGLFQNLIDLYEKSDR